MPSVFRVEHHPILTKLVSVMRYRSGEHFYTRTETGPLFRTKKKAVAWIEGRAREELCGQRVASSFADTLIKFDDLDWRAVETAGSASYRLSFVDTEGLLIDIGRIDKIAVE